LRLTRIFNDFVSLFYPKLCLACGQHVPPNQEVVCVSCQYHLPKTQFHLEKENIFTEHFWGRVQIQSAAALYYFNKKGKTQALIHQLKYKGKSHIGFKLGYLYGKQLKNAPHFNAIDLIVPVPLHPRKEKFRGYNQSDTFARGLSEAMEKPWAKHGLKRLEMTSSQTKKTRFERFANVQHAFAVDQIKQLRGKHILLVDDVMTTGATLEACAHKLLEVPNTQVSFATIGMAH